MKLWFLSITFLISNIACSQDFDPKKLDSLLTIIEANNKGMGSISIFENGEKVYENAIGYANVGEKIGATPETKYRIGSISKTFTASIIMLLVAEDKLQLDNKLSTFFPGVPNADRISIEQLLRHKSGIYNFTSDPEYQNYLNQPMTREQMLEKVSSYESVFDPGEKTEYSNSNYVLLTLIAEKIENQDFADILTDRICTPCGLDDTYYGMEVSEERKEARSYTWNQSWQDATETDMSIPLGAGALVSNPNDLNRFLVCLFNHQLVSEAGLDQMKQLENGMGLGLFQVPFYQKKGLGHNGGIDGFQTAAYYFPQDKVAISYFSNGVVMGVNDILIGALSIYFGKDYKFPEFTPALELTSEALDQYLGVYSSASFPLKVTITKDGNKLIGQATGQPTFPLEAYESHKFRFEAAGLTLEFQPAESKMILRQGGGEHILTKE